MSVRMEVTATDGDARTGLLHTPRGSIRTPCFMPVGTRGALRHLAADDLEDLGVEMMLANTYHLMLKPGAEVVADLGGLHTFMDWSGHVLTDSGGYQVFSLGPKVDDEGVRWKRGVLGHEGEVSRRLCRVKRALPENVDDALVGSDHAGDHGKRSCLSCSVAADEAKSGSAGHFQVQSVGWQFGE